jgi:microcystin-dependent protein
MTAAIGNSYWRDPLTDLRGGAIAIASQAANDFLFASSATQIGRLAAVSGQVPQFNGTNWAMANVLGAAWPVGSVYESVLSTNPATLLGLGTWVAFGTGRVTVGIDAGQAEFDTVEETGGVKTHQLTIAEMPSHTHVQNSHNHTQDAHSHTISNIGNTLSVAATDPDVSLIDNTGTKTTDNATATNNATTAVNQNTGGDVAHTNLQPYIVLYRWKRTA